MKAYTRRRSLLALAGLVGIVLTLSGCGQKGPLYLPEPEAKKKEKSGSAS